MGIAIHAEHLSKEYRLGVINHGMLYKDLQSWVARKLGKVDPHAEMGKDHFADQSDRFWALKDLSFDIQQGDRVGIIGRNGAGKSTLLKILSRITAPTEGVVKVKGRVVSLLEVGTGFHQELTGRENVYLNGAILGMKQRQIKAKLDEIIDFSEIEKFIDTPVKRYSSGMYIRLAFAVAANLDSEILLADEVLAVGDAAFQKKCLGKMDDVSQKEGRTVLFVSHNMTSVKQLCLTGMFLEGGVISAFGAMERVQGEYLGKARNQKSVWDGGAAYQRSTLLKILAFELLDESGRPIDSVVDNHDRVFVRLEFELTQLCSDLTIGFRLFNSSNESIFRSLTTDPKDGAVSEFNVGVNSVTCELPIGYLKSDTYSLNIDASLHMREWIIDPERAKDFSIGFSIVNSTFGPTHSTASLIAPSISWRRS
jgi:lipopolysaccharide transport system ATP-binding protein